MSNKSDIELKNFFIFNSKLGPKEGEVNGSIFKIIIANLIIIFPGTEKNHLLLPTNRKFRTTN